MTSLNKADPGNDTFAILDQLEDFRGADGKLEFKMRWPDAKNVWFQKSNPVTSDGVEGFEPVAVNYAQDFVGLAKNDQPGTTLSPFCSRGWFCIREQQPNFLFADIGIRFLHCRSIASGWR